MGESEALRKDPAIERFSAMRENTHLYFRLTARKLPAILLFVVGFPVAAYWASVYSMCYSDYKYGRSKQDYLGRCYICKGVDANPPSCWTRVEVEQYRPKTE